MMAGAVDWAARLDLDSCVVLNKINLKITNGFYSPTKRTLPTYQIRLDYYLNVILRNVEKWQIK